MIENTVLCKTLTSKNVAFQYKNILKDFILFESTYNLESQIFLNKNMDNELLEPIRDGIQVCVTLRKVRRIESNHSLFTKNGLAPIFRSIEESMGLINSKLISNNTDNFPVLDGQVRIFMENMPQAISC